MLQSLKRTIVGRSRRPRREHEDAGSILPLVIVGTFVISMVVVAVTTYATADLRYAQVVEDRADRLAAADGGLRYGVEKLRNFQTLCSTAAGTGGGLLRDTCGGRTGRLASFACFLDTSPAAISCSRNDKLTRNPRQTN